MVTNSDPRLGFPLLLLFWVHAIALVLRDSPKRLEESVSNGVAAGPDPAKWRELPFRPSSRASGSSAFLAEYWLSVHHLFVRARFAPQLMEEIHPGIRISAPSADFFDSG